MYIRFAVEQRDSESGYNMGVFMAMDELEYKDELLDYEVELVDNLYSWFKNNLRVPRVQSGRSSNYYRKRGAISWFKASATEHIDKMRQYSQILQDHSISVIQFTSDKPGKIVYDDDFQVAAVPFTDTFK